MFCEYCGKETNDTARFCVACGAALQTQAQPAKAALAQSKAAVVLQNIPGKKQCKKGLMDLLVIPIVIILLLMGTGSMVLTLAGRTVTAQVTGYEQVLIMNDDNSTRNPSRYKLEYQFAVNGERYDGSVTRTFEKGSHMRKTLRVRYLPPWPHVDAEDGSTKMVLAGPVMIGAGILLLVFGIKRRPRIGING